MTRKKRVGVMGSFVWDVIHGRDPRDAPVEEWGGITYALGALDAALPNDWEFVPILRVGSDLAHSARQFVAALDRGALDAAPIEVPQPNNRVVLHYLSDERRCERLSGGGRVGCTKGCYYEGGGAWAKAAPKQSRCALHQPDQRLRSRPRGRAAH